jgi:hypothetical protein
VLIERYRECAGNPTGDAVRGKHFVPAGAAYQALIRRSLLLPCWMQGADVEDATRNDGWTPTRCIVVGQVYGDTFDPIEGLTWMHMSQKRCPPLCSGRDTRCISILLQAGADINIRPSMAIQRKRRAGTGGSWCVNAMNNQGYTSC